MSSDGHSTIRPGSSSEISSESDVELSNLEDVAVTPNPQLQPGKHLSYGNQDESDEEDDLDSGDDGSRGLLSPRRVRSHGGDKIGIWAQVKGIAIESAPTLLLTTIGLLFTGELLDHVSQWRAMQEVNQLIMIIPVILNLKGNLEMNLSARLGTAANIGDLDVPDKRRQIILGNLSLLQLQATVVSFVAACVSFILGLIVSKISPPSSASPNSNDVTSSTNITMHVTRGLTTTLTHYVRRPRPHLPVIDDDKKPGLAEFVLVASTSMSAACLSSLLLGSFMCALILMCRRFGRNPDNIAPPVAACLGDLVTLCLLGAVSALLINFLKTPLPFILVVLVVISSISCGLFTYRNSSVKHLITQGWSPLFGAMVISSLTGIVLDLFVSRYAGFALLAVVISGLPGSVGSILVSRHSTSLHAQALSSVARSLNDEPSLRFVMLTLLIVTIPIEIIFLSIIEALGWLHLPFGFVALSMIFFCCAVTASLFLARALTNFLWSKNLDPDMYALPIHSAFMDLVGQLLLVVCFEIVQAFGIKITGK